jgi:hypothetical protein
LAKNILKQQCVLTPSNTPIDQPFQLRLFVENVTKFSSVFKFGYATDVEVLVGRNWLST